MMPKNRVTQDVVHDGVKFKLHIEERGDNDEPLIWVHMEIWETIGMVMGQDKARELMDERLKELRAWENNDG